MIERDLVRNVVIGRVEGLRLRELHLMLDHLLVLDLAPPRSIVNAESASSPSHSLIHLTVSTDVYGRCAAAVLEAKASHVLAELSVHTATIVVPLDPCSSVLEGQMSAVVHTDLLLFQD